MCAGVPALRDSGVEIRLELIQETRGRDWFGPPQPLADHCKARGDSLLDYQAIPMLGDR